MSSLLATDRPATSVRSYRPTVVPALKPSPLPGVVASASCANCRARATHFFCNFSEPSSRALATIKHPTSYPERALIFMEGEEARGVHILCSGRVKLQTTNHEGKTFIVKIAGPGEVLGLNSVIAGTPYTVSAEALHPSQLAFVRKEEFQRFLRDHSDACFHVAQELGRECHEAYESIRSIGLSSSVSEKLARFLIDWSSDGQVVEGVVRVKLALTHDEMAQLVGCSRETVSRTLSEFKRQRWVELNGATLVIRNRAALKELAAN